MCQFNLTLISVTFISKDNIQILRDLSLLQVQMRDTEGFRVCYLILFNYLNSTGLGSVALKNNQ